MSSFRQITTFSAHTTHFRGVPPHSAKSRPGARCSILPLHRLYYGSGESITGLLRDSYRHPDVHLSQLVIVVW